MKKGACVATNNASAPLPPRTVTNEVRMMLTAIQPDWQAQLAADPAHANWRDARQAEDQRAFDQWLDSPEGRAWLAAAERAEETRRYPYGRPEQDTGWYWETPAWGTAP